MEIRQEKFTIGEHEYVVSMLDPTIAVILGTKLIKAIGPAVGAALGSKTNVQELVQMDVSEELFSTAIDKLFENVDQKLVKEVIDTMKTVTSVDGKPLETVYAVHFRGRIGALMKWLTLAIKAQYGDFSGVLDFATGQGDA